LLISISIPAYGQFYIGPQVGFKSSGLEGVVQGRSGPQTETFGVWDAGITGFNLGITSGYQVLPPSG